MPQETQPPTAPDTPPEAALAEKAPRRRAPFRAIAVALAVVLLLLVFVPVWRDARLSAQGRVRGGVVMAGVNVGGRTRAELEAIAAHASAALGARRLRVRVGGRFFDIEPALLGLRVDRRASGERALAVGRDGNALVRLAGTWKRRFAPARVELAAALDRRKLESVVGAWEAQALANRPFPGGIALSGTTVAVLPPSGGPSVVIGEAERAILQGWLSRAPTEIALPMARLPAPLPAEAAEEVARHARRLLAGPLTLRSEDPVASVALSPAELAPVLRAERDGSTLRLAFDPNALAVALAGAKSQIEREPVNAKFVVDAAGIIGIEPSRPGLRIALESVGAALSAAAENPSRAAPLPLIHGPEPALGTEQAEHLGVRGLVSSFTTRHPCCEKRVDNIHRIADILDGTVVLPGQTVSVNALVGPRTLKNGFVPAPTIEEGEMVDSVGGGISQFATTFFNALFHGGYDIVERQPHSYWFPRYPMGHEATLSWPKPDIIFRNDTSAGMLIKTAYTTTSITVKIYGDNGGRKVRAEVSGRQNVVPAPLEIVPNPKLPPDEEKLKQPGSVGWSVIVSRVVTFADGTSKQERRRVTYSPRPRRIEVHPCRIPKGEKGYTGERCPEPEDVEVLDGGATSR